MKICKCCKQEKELIYFSVTRAYNDKLYYQSDCKLCKNRKKTLKRRSNPELEAIRKRSQRLRSNYKLSICDYNDIYKSQKGCCKICFIKLDKLNIDHCHATGLVRGLLCHNCNLGLGNFKDSSRLLSIAIQYLKESFTDKAISV